MAGVYIAYPFCSQKCTYCNFASGVMPPELERAYLAALADEIRRHAWQWTPETVYLGGGSPSRLAIRDLHSILQAIPGRPWREATIEAAPGEVTAEKAAGWAEAGITRASLGVQSFVPAESARTGRRHTPEIVRRDVEALGAAGIRRINIDLIAGLPGQTAASWETSLDWVARLGAGHVSVYMLEADEDSRLGREILAGGKRYGAADVPSEEAVTELYERAADRLAELGIGRYEISNFARPGEESLHNLKYWRLEPYAGFGADAHSFDGVARRQNAATAAEYVERHRRGETACVETVAARLDEERFFVGLRLRDGVRPTAEERRRFREPVSRFVADGLLEDRGDRLRLTRRGVLLSNEVFQEFIRI